MNEFSEILDHKLQRIASIQYMVVEKGISDDLNYGIRSESKESPNNGINVSKKGKEIKEALQKEFSVCVENKVSIFRGMSELVEKIGTPPTSSYDDDYISEGWKGKIDLPKKYCYDQLYKEDSVNNQNNPVEFSKEMRQYNELARKFIIASIESKKIQTIINHIEENKTYKLTIDIAAKLGF